MDKLKPLAVRVFYVCQFITLMLVLVAAIGCVFAGLRGQDVKPAVDAFILTLVMSIAFQFLFFRLAMRAINVEIEK